MRPTTFWERFSAMCEQEGHQCYIATGDRDSLQLIGKNTTVLLASSRAGKSETVVCDEAYFREKYGTEPQGLVDIKALMGDSSDNIPGVPGIGEKTALKLIGQYGTLDAVYENIDTLPVTKSVKRKAGGGQGQRLHEPHPGQDRPRGAAGRHPGGLQAKAARRGSAAVRCSPSWRWAA